MTALLATLAGLLAAAGIVDLAEARASRPPRGPRRSAYRALLALGRRVGLPAADRSLAGRLDAAGAPLAMEELLALKAGGAAAAGLAALPLAAVSVLVPAALAAAAFAAPDLHLRRRTTRRAERMQAELPDVADLLRVAIEAGLPVRRAVAEVGRRHAGLLAQELRQVAGLLELGAYRRDALEHLRRRAPVTGVHALALALDQTERTGVSPAEQLTALARRARADAARARQERAARAAPQVQLLIALVLVPSALLLVAAALVPALS